ncbi:ATP-binding cassette domain-containing protein [Carnobacterium divergens]|uniref:ATP-binding cassette domain-containing protein n=1 Tax=Carnobacterium divergens TaxID=2748 RepID=UPI0039AED46B
MDIQHLSKKISPSFSLSAITFTLKTGEITGLIGRNGNGKSSLFKTMVGLYQKDTGAVLIDGQEIEHFTEQKEHVFLLQDSIAYFDSLKLKEISAYYQLAYPRFNHDLFQRELKKNKTDIR